jgi:hypothetical protein
MTTSTFNVSSFSTCLSPFAISESRSIVESAFEETLWLEDTQLGMWLGDGDFFGVVSDDGMYIRYTVPMGNNHSVVWIDDI